MSRPEIDEFKCPFCGKKNNCMAHEKDRCWCCAKEVVFPKELTDLVAPQSKQKACICLSCVTSFNKDPESFTTKHSTG